jgi:hypothetical protein
VFPGTILYTAAQVVSICVGLLALTSPLTVVLWRQRQKRWERVERIGEAILGCEPTFDEPNPSPGLMQRMEIVEASMLRTERQVTPNGGDSERIGDRILRLERFLLGDDDLETK